MPRRSTLSLPTLKARPAPMPPRADEELSLAEFIWVIPCLERSLWAPHLCSRAAHSDGGCGGVRLDLPSRLSSRQRAVKQTALSYRTCHVCLRTPGTTVHGPRSRRELGPSLMGPMVCEGPLFIQKMGGSRSDC